MYNSGTITMVPFFIAQKGMIMNLYEILAKIDNPEDLKKFFADLCTYVEIENLEKRAEAAQLLLKGNTYDETIQKTGISSATISRISRCIRHGEGGYSEVLKKVVQENDEKKDK